MYCVYRGSGSSKGLKWKPSSWSATYMNTGQGAWHTDEDFILAPAKSRPLPVRKYQILHRQGLGWRELPPLAYITS